MVSGMPRAESDLTGRARIRDAALAEFAERGFGGASVRSVAARAEVSPGLVQHHFGTKDALRDACDAYVVDYVRRVVADGIFAGEAGHAHDLAGLMTDGPPIVRYLSWALLDGSLAAATLFDELVGVTESYLSRLPHPPPVEARHDRALVLTAMRLSTTLLAGHLARGMGVAGSDGRDVPSAVAGRTAAATVALLHPDLVPDAVRAGIDAAVTELAGPMTTPAPTPATPATTDQEDPIP